LVTQERQYYIKYPVEKEVSMGPVLHSAEALMNIECKIEEWLNCKLEETPFSSRTRYFLESNVVGEFVVVNLRFRLTDSLIN